VAGVARIGLLRIGLLRIDLLRIDRAADLLRTDLRGPTC
jgi:hypothetical protein